jgi:superfamily II DNA or RNA helicase
MNPHLKPGLYETIINEYYEKALNEIRDLTIDRKHLDRAESALILSKYLQSVLSSVLGGLNEDEIPLRQVELINRLIALLAHETGNDELHKFLIPHRTIDSCELKTDILLALRHKNDISDLRPLTPLTAPSLFTGSHAEPSLYSEIKKEIATSDRIDMLISFIKWSGLRLLIDDLKEFTEKSGHSLRIITTSYMGATDYRSIEFLARLPNTEVKISYDTQRTRLHAKSYLFHRDTGYTTAYIGSSNISHSAMSSGLEWNIKITRSDSPHIIGKFTGTFESYWNDREFHTFDPSIEEDKKILRTALDREKPDDAPIVLFDIKPWGFQQEILEKLEAERKLHNNYKNLIVAATGTGKTVISAFDYRNFRRARAMNDRILFVAHREEILKQSLDIFRNVLRDRNFGDYLVGGHSPSSLENLFISIQSFNSKELFNMTDPDYYSYIVIDEFHHGAAQSYQMLLEHYKPEILIGLTATPERMDGRDITGYFNRRFSAEIRLPEAIERKMLVPFHYFGITDSVDLDRLTWQRGGYLPADLDKLYTGNDRRADLIIKALTDYLISPRRCKAIGFCVSIEHAEFMARHFNKRGLPCCALTSRSGSDERKAAHTRLRRGEIHCIFTVDLYNEGVDIPEVDTILLLRPTESLTVFLQQIGRGLRLHGDEKDCCTILDFVGAAHKNYNFEERFRALIGRTRNSVDKEIESEFPHLPSGSHIHLEKVAREHILNNIRHYFTSGLNALKNKVATFENDSGRELTLSNFLRYYNLQAESIYRHKDSSWSKLCFLAGVRSSFPVTDESVCVRLLRRISAVDSVSFLDFIENLLRNLEGFDYGRITEIERQMLMMLFHTMFKEQSKESEELAIKEIFDILIRNRVMADELADLIEYKKDTIDVIGRKPSLNYPCALDVHCGYTRDEILSALLFYSFVRKVPPREGVCHIKDRKTDVFFVTLNKSEKDYSPTTMYEDYAINEDLFHWQSQSTTSEASETGRRYIGHRERGNTILLFVRENRKEQGNSMPYYFLGPVSYMSHQGNKPINFIWRLEFKIPARLLKYTRQLAIA